MKLNRETRRTVAQFLNGLAVTILATLVLTPLATENLQPGLSAAAVAGAAVVHALAVRVGK